MQVFHTVNGRKSWPPRNRDTALTALMNSSGFRISVEVDRVFRREDEDGGRQASGFVLVPYCEGCNRTLCAPSGDVFIREETFDDWSDEALDPVVVALLANASDASRCRCP